MRDSFIKALRVFFLFLLLLSAIVLILGLAFPKEVAEICKAAFPSVYKCTVEKTKEEAIPAAAAVTASCVYENPIDGYRLSIPEAAVIDDSLQECRTTIRTDRFTLDIYRENFSTADETNSYLNYSNQFSADTKNFRIIDRGTKFIGNRKTSYLSWSRPEFTVIKNDRNYFSCYDIVDDNTVYTLLFHYNDSVSRKYEIQPIAESFSPVTATKTASVAKLGTGSSPKLNQTAEAAFQKLFGDSTDGITWGIFDQRAVSDLPAFRAFEKKLGYTFPILLIYTSFQTDPGSEPKDVEYFGAPLAEKLSAVCDSGQMPELTLQTDETENGENMMFAVLQGKYDAFLHNYAKEVVTYGKPVLFRVGNEMNGDWCPYSGFRAGRDPDAYITFYQYIFRIFQEEGADNCIWVWNPNGRSFPDYKWNSDIVYYPGDAYVNVLGLTAYNTGTYYEGETWTSFLNLYNELYRYCDEHYAQPMMITEFASSSVGGRKDIWIRNMFTYMKRYPRIRAAVWWNGCDYADYVGGTIARPYYLEESDRILQAFRTGLLSKKS